jgi:predicted Fe-Mo cluster-binding NifX family protein
MLVAISVDEEKFLAQHLGRCSEFALYEKNGPEVIFKGYRIIEDKFVEALEQGMFDDCKVIISGKIGDTMVKSIRKRRIRPYIELEMKNPYDIAVSIY